MRNKNAAVIIPFVIIVWLLTLLIGRDAPTLLQVGFFLAVGVAILFIVLYLMTDTGWRSLARAHPATVPFTSEWQTIPAGNISRVSVRDPDFARNRTRFASVLRAGATGHALYLSTLFSRVPILRIFFPTVEIPWSAVRAARPYEATGWVTPSLGSQGMLRATYDPNYTGTFVEMVIGEPPVFIQLPLTVLGEGAAQLQLETV